MQAALHPRSQLGGAEVLRALLWSGLPHPWKYCPDLGSALGAFEGIF